MSLKMYDVLMYGAQEEQLLQMKNGFIDKLDNCYNFPIDCDCVDGD